MTNEELVIKIKAGIDTANNMFLLWQQCKTYIKCVALHYQGMAELDDLEQEGYLALYKSIDGFIPEKGNKFITYADYWIRWYMLQYIRKNAIIKIPAYEHEIIRQYDKLINFYVGKQGRKPNRKEIAEALFISEKNVINCERVSEMRNVASLDCYVFSEMEGTTVAETIADEKNLEAEILEKEQQKQLREILWRIVETLPEEQSAVLIKRYKESLTLKETGECIGVSIEKVRQIEAKATRNIRCSKKARLLRSFIDETIESNAYRHNTVREFHRTWTSSTELTALKIIE